MILIGSTAIKWHFPDFPRKPKDVDYVIPGNPAPHKSSRECEYLVNPVLYTYYFSNQSPYQQKYFKRYGYIVCGADELYTLKMSHVIGWKLENNSWDKHLWDLTWLQNKGCKLNYPLFWKLYAYWKIVHGENRRSELQMSAEDFFDNALKCPYSHDWLHTLIQSTPTYTKVLVDGADVEVSEKKFNQLTEDEKEALVREEIMVMAFERYSQLDWPFAYHRMIKKFVLNHAPIWEAIWMLENWPTLVKAKFNFIKHLNEQIKQHGEYITV